MADRLLVDTLEGCVMPGTLFWNHQGTRGAVVPYDNDFRELPDSLERQLTDAIQAFNHDERLRVLFRPKLSADKIYVKFIYDPKVFAATESPLGRHDGARKNHQCVYLNTEALKGNVMHELMHVLGFAHEHQREDRVGKVQIVPDFKSPAYYNVNFAAAGVAVPPQARYDVESIMHYPNCKAIRLKDEYVKGLIADVYEGKKTASEINAQVGQRKQLSCGDVAAVNYIYGGVGCTYAAFLDEKCQHKHYTLVREDGVTLHICLNCHDNCYSAVDQEKMVVVAASDEGFVCACAKRDDHKTAPYIVHN